jgi:uncharacterized protein
VIELPMVFMAGILGTAHCLGMCGPFALAIGGAGQRWPVVLFRQAAYTAGRIFTYATLGAVAGYCGARLIQLSPRVVYLPAFLAMVAGAVLIYQGLAAAGLLPKRTVGPAPSSCLTAGFFKHFLRPSDVSGAFLAGVFTGFLPCGLLYGMLTLAMSTHSVLLGALTMAFFGLGTAPGMILTGVGGRLLHVAARRWLFALAAWCLVLTGAVSLLRGASFISASASPSTGCPACGPN